MTWTNWAGDEACSPARVVRPRSVDELHLVSGDAVVAVAPTYRGEGHAFL